MSMDIHFSAETKEVIGKARDVALDLGCDQISTVHFFIANCLINGNYSPQSFLFKEESDFKKFYDSQRECEAKPIEAEAQTIGVTEEAEASIRLSLKLKRKIKSKQVQPVHLLLAACKVQDSLLGGLLKPRTTSYERLYNFYKEKEYLIDRPKTNIWMKIKMVLDTLATKKTLK